MPSLTLKNVPPELLEELRTLAIQHRRSLNQQTIHLLEAAVEAPSSMERLDAEAQVAAWRELAGQWRSDVDPDSELEDIRDARTPGRLVDL